ncbi:MAG: 16S rRNA (guanine(527)-N(7))-methyltransferase RsmG [Synergistaceae bacterium]|jgi:16S rRNA (guanine527-N7)-methyltransferase|nr:16S rRNA (guanine(527)-N(7))-methyltransferase RsmG [Synergistaceae bacterium]
MDEETIQKLRRYAGLLGAANAKARLTGPSDPDTLYDEHITDALAALPYLPENLSFVDVGTGGGLPGLVWCICRPAARGTLLDSIGKKIALVAEMAEELGCSNAEAVNRRSEDFARERREGFDIATARAVADARVLVEYLSPLVRAGGRLIAFKGKDANEETDLPGSKWRILGLSKPELFRYSIAGKERFLVIWEKIGPCRRRYPRKPGDAVKSPWWF